MRVTLTRHEMQMMTWAGNCRYENAMANNRNPGEGPSKLRNGAGNTIRGTAAEYAASIMLNLYWRPTAGILNEKDVGGIVEVRTTIIDAGRLIVKPADIKKSPFTPFVLIHVAEPVFTFLGWMLATNASVSEYLEKYGDPAFFVKQSELNDFASLYRIAHLECSKTAPPTDQR